MATGLKTNQLRTGDVCVLRFATKGVDMNRYNSEIVNWRTGLVVTPGCSKEWRYFDGDSFRKVLGGSRKPEKANELAR